MKVLFDHPSPFVLAHGGFQIQIEQTFRALRETGVDVEYLRWWDAGQTGDVIHYFGRPDASYIRFAHTKGMKVVLAELLTGLGSRGRIQRLAQKSTIMAAQATLPSAFTARLAWDAYRLADACVALTAWEGHLMSKMFAAPPERVHIVPNGVEFEFFQRPPQARGPWLICTATITERKRVLELAQAAVAAETPLWIIGKPYSDSDPYARRFLAFAGQHPRFVRYEGPIADRTALAAAYREARGFVLLSTMESLSLSALEAAACECPLLLSALPWARSTFGDTASYCPISSVRHTSQVLGKFYANAPALPRTIRPLNWNQVATKLRQLYQQLLIR